MKTKELRELSAAELNEKLAESQKELFTLRFQHATAQLEKTHRLPEVKKGIARMKTILKEKEAGA
ncbi:MAG: 50S ribosomal protein L29 [Thermodesulfobacteriota bacterium]